MSKTCSVTDCGSPVKSKGMCKLHYQRSWRTGSATVSRPRLHLPIEQKFWLYVDKNSDSECWNWTGFKDKDGYGKIRIGNTNRGAHRISWALHFGDMPEGVSVLHNCNNPSCVNPSHLRSGDHNENMIDRLNAGNYPVNERHPGVKFSNEIVRKVRASTGTNEQISRLYGISESQVSNIRRGRQRPPVEQEEDKA